MHLLQAWSLAQWRSLQTKGPTCQDSQVSRDHTVQLVASATGAGVSGTAVGLELCAEGAVSSFLLCVRLGHPTLSSLSPE